MAKAHKPQLGSISSDTLRSEDLLQAFLDELCWVAPGKHGTVKREARRILNLQREWTDDDQEAAGDTVNELQDALNEHAPDFMSFGANEGDGACFGWWPDMETIEELPAFDDVGKAQDARYRGEFKTISDHGNVEVYCRFGNGHIKSLLGIV